MKKGGAAAETITPGVSGQEGKKEAKKGGTAEGHG